MKGVTMSKAGDGSDVMFQSTLPMKGVTHQSGVLCIRLAVSIHTPNEGSDLPLFAATMPTMFQSTLPMKGVTLVAVREGHKAVVSIHTPNEGSDDKDRS